MSGRFLPVVEVTRGGVVESIHAAAIALVDEAGAVRARIGDVDTPVFMRSAIKPLQAMAVVESGAMDRFGLGAEDLAVMCGSHGSEPFHVAAVERILNRCGLDATALRCGTHTPFHRGVAEAYRRAGRAPARIDHNCSGKHAGMLAAALAGGHDTRTYMDPAHPVQQQVLRIVSDMSGCDRERVVLATDGCGVPSIGLGLAAAARAFARLAGAAAGGQGGGHAEAARRVVAAMRAHPQMVAGTGMSDSIITAHPRHGMLAKRGAEGVQGLGFVREGSGGWGLVAKIGDGNNGRARLALIREALNQLGLMEAPDLDAIDPDGTLTLLNDAGQPVGEVRAVLTLPRV